MSAVFIITVTFTLKKLVFKYEENFTFVFIFYVHYHDYMLNKCYIYLDF